MRKVFNFNAGPAMLPEEVLLEAQSELLDWHGTGMSIMELGHRGSEFQELAAKTEADLRELMSIPKHYHIFFLPGGATAQFAMVPLNLLGQASTADYVDTGIWSKKAIEEAKRYGKINVVASIEKREYGWNHIEDNKRLPIQQSSLIDWLLQNAQFHHLEDLIFQNSRIEYFFLAKTFLEMCETKS